MEYNVVTHPIAFSFRCGLNFNRGLSLLLRFPLLDQLESFAALLGPCLGCSLAGLKLDEFLHRVSVEGGGTLIVKATKLVGSTCPHRVGIPYRQQASCRCTRKLERSRIYNLPKPRRNHFVLNRGLLDCLISFEPLVLKGQLPITCTDARKTTTYAAVKHRRVLGE